MNTSAQKIRSFNLLGLLLPVLLFSSCARYPKLVNFNQGEPFPEAPVEIQGWEPLRIQTDDLLYVSILGGQPEVLQDFQPREEAMTSSADSNQPLRGYLVDAGGRIHLPVLGPVPAAGLTTEELRQDLEKRLQPYLEAPVVKVRFMNFKVTVLGEVALPGVVRVDGERLNLLEAIGRAGDITKVGNRERILIIREQNGQRSFNYVNLRDRNIFQSPYFYLQQNDLIYVEPDKTKTYVIADGTSKILPWAGVVTALLNLVLILSR